MKMTTSQFQAAADDVASRIECAGTNERLLRDFWESLSAQLVELGATAPHPFLSKACSEAATEVDFLFRMGPTTQHEKISNLVRSFRESVQFGIHVAEKTKA